MAAITFLNRRKPIASYHLSGSVTVGRSLDCDIYIPDVFVSRKHCRIVSRDGNWYIVDSDSRNGIWCAGVRHKEYLLKPGDIVEIGTAAIAYNTGTPDGPSNPAPYGMGLGVTELMDTVFAQNLRPSAYTKRQAARSAEFLERAKHQAVHQHQEVDQAPEIDTEPWIAEDWAELDMEKQLAAAQENMTEWRAPIFNPRPEKLAAMLGQTVPAASPTPSPAAAPAVEEDSVDDIEIEIASRQIPAAKPRKSFLAGVTSWIPFVGRSSKTHTYGGVVIEKYTWTDRLKDKFSDGMGSARGLMGTNPLLAGVGILVVLLLIAGIWKFGSGTLIKSGPHIYVEPDAPAKPQALASKKAAD